MNWKIEKRKLTDLKPFEKNPRILTKKGMADLKKSIDKFGLAEPIIIQPNGTIIGGHARIEVLKQKGTTQVDVYVPERALNEQEYKELNIRLNKNIAGEFDFEMLANHFEMDELIEWGFEDVELTGYFENEAVEDDFVIPDKIKTDIKLGDLFQIGDHRLLCGDATKKEDVERLMNGEKADMVLSDPPYGMNLDTDFSSMKSSMKLMVYGKKVKGNKYEKVIGDNEDFKPELITSIFDNFGYCKEIFLFGADYYADLLVDKNKGSWLVWDKRKESQSQAIGSEFELLWSKQKHKRRMLRHDWFGFLSSQNGSDARNKIHPTQKPVSLLSDILNQWGKDAKIIVDLFLGSGSTMIACEQLNRKCYGLEISPEYCAIILRRMKTLDNSLDIKNTTRTFDIEKELSYDKKQEN